MSFVKHVTYLLYGSHYTSPHAKCIDPDTRLFYSGIQGRFRPDRAGTRFIPLIQNKKLNPEAIGAVFSISGNAIIRGRNGEWFSIDYPLGAIARCESVALHGPGVNHIGQIPEGIMEHLTDEGLPATVVVNYNVEYTRGPKVTVDYHVVDLDALDAAFDSLTLESLLAIDPSAQQHAAEAMASQDSLRQSVFESNPKLAAFMILLRAGKRSLTLKKSHFIDHESTELLDLFNPNKNTYFFGTPNAEIGMVDCYRSVDDMFRDRITTLRAGKWAKARFPHGSDEAVKQIANNIIAESTPTTFIHTSNGDDIFNVYRRGPSSCATKPTDQYSVQNIYRLGDEYHPVRIYADSPDVELVYSIKGDLNTDGSRVLARTLVNKHTKKYIRIYPDGTGKAASELLGYLTSNGYTRDPAGLLNTRLKRVDLPNSVGCIMKPYIDTGGYACLVTDQWLIPFQGESIKEAPPEIKELVHNSNKIQALFTSYSDGAGRPQHVHYCRSCSALGGDARNLLVNGALVPGCSNCTDSQGIEVRFFHNGEWIWAMTKEKQNLARLSSALADRLGVDDPHTMYLPQITELLQGIEVARFDTEAIPYYELIELTVLIKDSRYHYGQVVVDKDGQVYPRSTIRAARPEDVRHYNATYALAA